jgi:hypothetical protein
MALFRRKQAQTRTTTTTPSAAAFAEGWNGLPWGASLSAFRERYPAALLTDAGWWQTGESPEPFCGVPMAITQYAFNDRDEMSTVAFIPDPADRPQLSVAAVNELGAPGGMDLVWTFGDVVAEVKLAGVIAMLTHPGYAGQ